MYKKDPFGLKGMQKQFEKNIKEMRKKQGLYKLEVFIHV
jgi:hypothetical protein